MKNKDLLSLYETLKQLDLIGVRFNYAVARNIAKLKPEIESLFKAQEKTKEFSDFDLKRVEIAKKYSKKDEKGDPVIVDNKYDIDDQEGLQKEFDTLKSENTKVIEEREKQLEVFNELLEQENDIELYTISSSEIPQEISTKQLSGILSIVKDENIN